MEAKKLYIVKSPNTGSLFKARSVLRFTSGWELIWMGEPDTLPTDFMDVPWHKAHEDTSHKESVNHPNHYNKGKIETIEYLKETLPAAGYEGFLAGNVLKYVSRYDAKGGVEDLKKARNYLNWLIEHKDNG